MPAPPPLDTPEDERSLERYLIVGLVLMVLLVVAFPFYRATEPDRRARALADMQRQNIELGREAYALHCAACHGDEGRGGRGIPTLAAKEFLADVSDAQLQWLVAGGIPGTTMAAYDLDLGGPFTAQEIERVVAYLRSLETTAARVPSWRSGAAAPVVAALAGGDITVSPARTEAPGTSPERLSAPVEWPSAEPTSSTQDEDEDVATAQATCQTFCGSCHGPTGEGTPIAPAVRPPNPPLDTDFDALVAAIGRGRPGTAMAGFDRAAGGPLDSEAILALARWLMGGEQ